MYGARGFRECHGDYRQESDMEDTTLPLYRFQKDLPRLPVPKLSDTITLYLRSVKPLVTPEQFAHTTRVAKEFLNSPFAQTLQKRLQGRAEERNDSSYLAEWWNQMGYLQVRDPVVFNVSYFFHFADPIDPRQKSQVGRAASLTKAALIFREQVVNGTLEPEQLGRNKTPICATAYKYMFNACRIPQKQQDAYRIYDPARNNHIVVMRHNKFFKVDVVNDRQEALTFTELCHQFQRVMAQAGGKESAIGALSSANRDHWADSRAQLLALGNEESLRVVESSILIVNMDSESPVTKQEAARALWHGDGRNRFYDKCVQLIVFGNGKAGLLGEHSMLDGMPMSRFADFVVTGLYRNQIEMGKHDFTTQELNRLKAPTQIPFNFSSQVLERICEAEYVFDRTVADHEVATSSYYGYGAKMMKQLKCSPDAFVQLAIQLAYHKLFGIHAATYEATQTRTYLHGRTETTRSCSPESAAFTSAMVAAQPRTQPKELARHLRKALDAHVAYMRQASKGCGVDRHLMGLQLLIQDGEDVPAFFQDAAMKKAKYWFMSTSHLTNELFDGWGWGEVVPDGLGIAYSVKNDSVQFNVACRQQRRDWAKQMVHYLEESLLEMKQVLQADAQDSKL